MTTPTSFARRMKFLGKRIEENGARILTETNLDFRKIAQETLEHHVSLTPVSKPRPDREDNPRHLIDGWRLVETGSVDSADYAVRIENVHDELLTDKYGKTYRKSNGNFFTILDAVDIGIAPHTIKAESRFYFWWDRESRYFGDKSGDAVINHPGTQGNGVLRIPRIVAAGKTRNLRRRVQRRLTKIMGSRP